MNRENTDIPFAPRSIVTLSFLTFIFLGLEKYLLGFGFLYGNIQGTLDSAQYWVIGNNISSGLGGNLSSWWLWSIGFPYVLSILIDTSKLLGLNPLTFVHAVFCLFHALSVFPMFWFAKSICSTERRAFIATVIYAFAIPILWLNLFVMSENLAIPFMVLCFGLISIRSSFFFYLLSGLALGFSVFMRPSMGLFAVTVGLLIFLRPGVSILSRFITSSVFSFSFLLIVGFAVYLEGDLTDGKISGLSPNIGIAHTLGTCRPAGYAFICSDCMNDEGNTCRLSNLPWKDGETFKFTDMTYDEFNKQGSCIFTKGGSASAAKLDGVGRYVIFNSPPWVDISTSAATLSCLESMSFREKINNYGINLFSMMVSVDNLYIHGISKNTMDILAALHFFFIIVLMLLSYVQFFLFKERRIKHYILFLSIMIPCFMGLFFISVLRYMNPVMFIMAAFAVSNALSSKKIG